MKKFLIVFAVGIILTALYLVEFAKIEVRSTGGLLTLDNLEHDSSGELWDLFYKVRATIIDGQSASFDIPPELEALAGRTIIIKGAAAFRGEGSGIADNEHVAITFFDLMPLVSMTYGCEILPEISMRWTVVVSLRDEWILSREEMIDAEVLVRGRFRIDTAQPYNAAFFIDDAVAELVE